MSDAQKIKDAVEKYKEAEKEATEKLKIAANQIRQVHREAMEKSNH